MMKQLTETPRHAVSPLRIQADSIEQKQASRPFYTDEVMEELWQVKEELSNSAPDMASFFALISKEAARLRFGVK